MLSVAKGESTKYQSEAAVLISDSLGFHPKSSPHVRPLRARVVDAPTISTAMRIFKIFRHLLTDGILLCRAISRGTESCLGISV